jgi:pimeloyl-ACP methyl ester carboxylesterase
MNPIRLRYVNRALKILSKAEISRSGSLAFKTKKTLVRHAITSLLVSSGIFLMFGNYRVNAEVVASATSLQFQSPMKVTWHNCGKNLECAQVRVPLDWNRSWGATISLSVARHLASKPNQRIGSLFVNFGGPGVAAVPIVKASGEGLDGLLGEGRFDIVGWDPRGTGESTDVSCFQNDKKMEQFWGEEWTLPTTPLSSWLYVPKTIEFARRCTEMSGSLLAHISTADTVRDLDYLRQVVGDPQLNYRGLSYGAFLGQTYANMFPDLVRTMILDANIDPVPFTTSVKAAMSTSGSDTDLVFEQFLSLCQQAGSVDCKLAGNGEVTTRMKELLARLRQGPIPAPRAPAPHELRYGDVQIELWATLGTPAKWRQLADDLNQAADGDGSNLAITFREGRSAIQKVLISATALQCADKPLLPRGSVLDWPRVMQHLTETNFLGTVEGWWLWAPCASWRVPSAERYTGPWNATTANPILVIGNRYDPRTRYANSVLASQRLGNAALLTLDGYGHTSDADPSDCIDQAVTKYLITTVAPPTGTVCQPNHAPFDPDFEKPLLREQPPFE